MKKILSLLLIMAMMFSILPVRVFAEENDEKQTFIMQQIPGKTKKDVKIGDEERVIYCMQYDDLWPIIDYGYSESHSPYWQATGDELLLTQAQMDIIQRVLYAGYPYDSLGYLETIYSQIPVSFGANDIAADLTQAVIWTLMLEFGVAGNDHWTVEKGYEVEFDGWVEAFDKLMIFAKNGPVLSQIPESFTPVLNGSTNLTEVDGKYRTEALSITNPEGFVIPYTVKLPEGAYAVDENGNKLVYDFDLVTMQNLGYIIYGGTTFYVETTDAQAIDQTQISITGTIKLPTEAKQYNTSHNFKGWKEWDGYTENGKENYTNHDVQTMLSVGIISKDLATSATLTYQQPEEKVGSLTISKTVKGNDVDADKSFAFTITLSDTTFTNTLNDVEFINGEAEVSLVGGTSVTIEGLPADITYTVVENDYSNEGYVCDNPNGITGCIEADKVSTAAFTNTRNSYGSLTVTKSVEGEGADLRKKFSFTVELSDTSITDTFGDMTFTNGVASFQLSDREMATAEGLPNGIGYTVTEEDYTSENYTANQNSIEGTIVGNEDAEVIIINTYIEPENPDIPRTGADSHISLWLGLMVASGVALVATTAYSRKEEQ